uniref:Uncharacterized protein n=1 Tax=Quercus lobata TaxID=97700 RepID=A0A7N2LT09_QUELO
MLGDSALSMLVLTIKGDDFFLNGFAPVMIFLIGGLDFKSAARVSDRWLRWWVWWPLLAPTGLMTLQSMASMLGNEDKLKRELYNAILKEDVGKVIELCEGFDDHAMHGLTIHGDTVLHVATYSKQTGLVLRLLEALHHHHIQGRSQEYILGGAGL